MALNSISLKALLKSWHTIHTGSKRLGSFCSQASMWWRLRLILSGQAETWADSG